MNESFDEALKEGAAARQEARGAAADMTKTAQEMQDVSATELSKQADKFAEGFGNTDELMNDLNGPEPKE